MLFNVEVYSFKIHFAKLCKQAFVTFRVRRGRGEMYGGHGRLCVCVDTQSLYVTHAAFPHYCTDPDVTWEMVGGALQVCTIGRICSQCTGFVAMTTQRKMRNVSKCFYSLSLCAWFVIITRITRSKRCLSMQASVSEQCIVTQLTVHSDLVHSIQ